MIESELKSLEKVQPEALFLKQSRARLLHRVRLDQEIWTVRLIRDIGLPIPSTAFLSASRDRLLARIQAAPLHSGAFFPWFRRMVASTVAMTLVVLSTLFFVDGGQYVSAYRDTYLQVRSGNVLLRHSGEEEWITVDDRSLVMTGDTLQLNPGAIGVVTFFNDSQLRLTDRAALTFNAVDPTARRSAGLVDVSLLAGRAWLQSINVPADHRSFTVHTPDTVVGADNASLGLVVDVTGSTTVRLFKHQANVSVLNRITGDVLAQAKLPTDKQLTLRAENSLAPDLQLTRVDPIQESRYDDPWVRDNIAQDALHLLALQEKELTLRQKYAGVLPGHFLYPLKQAKERVSRALAFTEDGQYKVQLQIANKRLTEAIVLASQDQYSEAQNALTAYQAIVRQLANDARSNPYLKAQVETDLILHNTKGLMAALPAPKVNIVREALDTTEEMISTTPLELEMVRLKNAVDGLNQLLDYVPAESSEEIQSALLSYETLESRVLTEANRIEDLDTRKMALDRAVELRSDALLAVGTLKERFSELEETDPQLVSILNSVDQTAQREVTKAASVVAPLLPQPIQVKVDPLDKKAMAFVEKVEIYSTWQGQKNQVRNLLNQAGKDAKNIEFLAKVRSQMTSPFARDMINSEILELKQKARINKHKAVQRKIDQSQSLRGR